ncbi:MAG: PP2C family protein-serine/threonine phosphatase [Actinomycetota bacterium]
MRLSLRWKIVGGFGLLLVLIVLLGWVTLSLFSSLRDVQRRVFNDAVPGVVAVDEIVRSYTAQNGAVRGFLVQANEILLEQYRSEVVNVNAVLEDSSDLFTSELERELIDELSEAGDSFQKAVEEQVVPLAEEGERARAQALFSSDAAPFILEIERLGTELRNLQREVVLRAEQSVQTRSNQARITLVAVIIGALAAGLALTILLPRRLSASLSELVEAARAIGRGDFDQRIDIRSGDEVEELGLRFTEMQAGLKRLQQLALQDRELEIAGAIQRNLLQRSLPATSTIKLVPTQRQANLVGGDWYDVDVSASSVTVVVGDASGKGIAAALMATVALSVLRAERSQGASVRRIIERANEALKEATEPESFTTLVYATVDSRSGKASWLNMGHPSPFILTAREAGSAGSQNKREAGSAGSQNRIGSRRGYFLEGPRNRALGWFEEPGMAESAVQLAPGDRLIFYTDGFLEAKSPEGAIFGENRFAEALLRLAPLGSDDLGEELVRDVERFAAGKLEDDLTMIVIEFQGSPLSDDAADEELTGDAPWHSRR